MRKVTYLCDICGAKVNPKKNADEIEYFIGVHGGQLKICRRSDAASGDICPTCFNRVQSLFYELLEERVLGKKEEN